MAEFEPRTRRIFLASICALFTAGLSFSLRATVIGGIEADVLEVVLRGAAATSFQTLAILPAVLIVVFGAIALWDRTRWREGT